MAGGLWSTVWETRYCCFFAVGHQLLYSKWYPTGSHVTVFSEETVKERTSHKFLGSLYTQMLYKENITGTINLLLHKIIGLFLNCLSCQDSCHASLGIMVIPGTVFSPRQAVCYYQQLPNHSFGWTSRVRLFGTWSHSFRHATHVCISVWYVSHVTVEWTIGWIQKISVPLVYRYQEECSPSIFSHEEHPECGKRGHRYHIRI